LTAGTIKRLLLLMAALCLCLGLGGCAPLAGAVSDAWPTWAGGEPKDVPPRPGAPGYEEFIAHQQRQDVAPNGAPNAAAAPGTTAVVAPAGAAPGTTAAAAPVTAPAGTTAAVPPATSRYTPPPQAPLPPAYARPDDRSATQGGLY
jgi:hypothetical protein